MCARFRVQVAADAPRTTEIVNQGAASFIGLTLGTQFPEELSNAVTNVVAGADLVPTKTHAGGTFVGGQAYDFTLGVANAGDLPTDGHRDRRGRVRPGAVLLGQLRLRHRLDLLDRRGAR